MVVLCPFPESATGSCTSGGTFKHTANDEFRAVASHNSHDDGELLAIFREFVGGRHGGLGVLGVRSGPRDDDSLAVVLHVRANLVRPTRRSPVGRLRVSVEAISVDSRRCDRLRAVWRTSLKVTVLLFSPMKLETATVIWVVVMVMRCLGVDRLAILRIAQDRPTSTKKGSMSSLLCRFGTHTPSKCPATPKSPPLAAAAIKGAR